MAGDGDLRCLAEVASFLGSVGEGALGQCQRIGGLHVVAGDHHGAIGEEAIAGDLLGAAM
ncbi:hypothetical protein D3C81_1180020 [compost metagenome]